MIRMDADGVELGRGQMYVVPAVGSPSRCRFEARRSC
jgi:hypothetical protein